jgi:PAS domain S-box-containing protein
MVVNKYLESFFKFSQELFCVVDLDTARFTHLNPAWETHLGWTLDELKAEPYTSFIHPDDILKSSEVVEDFKKDEGYLGDFQNRYLCKSGKYVLLAWKSMRDDSTGNHFAIARNITREKEALSKSKILDIVLESTMAGYWDWHIPSNYEFLSPTFKMMFGYEEDELENTPASWQKLIFKEDLAAILDTFEKHVSSRGSHPFTSEARYRHKDGSTVHVFCRGKVIEWGENGEPLRAVGSHIDITSFKELLHKYEVSSKKLEQERQYLSTFLSILAHDLKAPLGHIRNFSYFLKEDLGERVAENIEVAGYFDKIESAAAYAGSIVDDVHVLSKVNQSRFDKKVSLKRAVSGVLKDISEDIEAAGARVLVGKGLPVIRGNIFCVQQVLANLVRNSLKFSKEGVVPEIEIKAFVCRGERGIVVKDRGIGVPEEKLEVIFSMFTSLNRAEYEGTGAGLAIVRRVMDMHNGRVWAERRSGGGLSIFLIFGDSDE